MDIRLARTLAILTFAVPGSAITLGAQQKTNLTDAEHKIIQVSGLKWTPIIKGCDLASVSGDFKAEGAPYVLRIRCAAGTKVPAHWHPTDENITVLKGTFLVGMGESFDEAKLMTMDVGNFTIVPKEMRHFARCKGETIVQVHGIGPFANTWVNPAEVIPPDAPTAKKKS